MNIDLFKVMTFKEATDYLGKSPSYLNNMVATGRLIEGEHYRAAGSNKLILKSIVDKIKQGYKMLTVDERENIIKECVETEMTEGCHLDWIEDYNSPLEFYLSEVERDNYIEYLQDNYNVDEEDALSLQKDIIEEIKARC